MRAISGKELTRLLERHGWDQGSHHIYGKSGSAVRLSDPVHGNRPLRIGLLRHLLKMAGLPEDAV